MSGSSRAYNVVSMTSVRMAGPATYTPANMPAGSDKSMSQRATFNVMQNSGDTTHTFSCTVWGKLADAIARGGAKGKEISITGEMRSYRGKVYVPAAQGGRVPYQLPDGSFLMQTKVNVLVQKFNFHSDSDQLIDDEVAKGLRPALWNVNRTPDNIAWKNVCQQRNAVQFAPGMEVFGYARVVVPQGVTLVDPNTRTSGTGQVQGNDYGQPAAGVQQGFQQVAPQGGFQPQPVQAQAPAPQAGWGQPQVQPVAQPQAPAQGGWAQPAAQPVAPQGGFQAPPAGQPVTVNGQTMGFAPPAQPGFQPPAGPATQQQFAPQGQVAPAAGGVY